jgi:hypothetical protein
VSKWVSWIVGLTPNEQFFSYMYLMARKSYVDKMYWKEQSLPVTCNRPLFRNPTKRVGLVQSRCHLIECNWGSSLLKSSSKHFYGVKRYFQQYFSYIVAVSFIGGGNRRTRRKPTDSDILSWFRANQSLFLLLNAAY